MKGHAITTYTRARTPTQPPQQPMPSRRIPVAAQIRLLIAASRLGGSALRAFSIHDAAAQAGVASGSARYATRFLVATGLWTTGSDSTTYSPTEPGREFGLCWETSREQARMIVNRLFKDMWFHATLCRHLAHGPVPIETMEQALLADSGGHPQQIKLVTYLLEWQTIAYLIEQTSDGMVLPGPHLGADLHSGPSNAGDGLPLSEAASPETEPNPHDAGTSAQTLLAALVIESLSVLDPDELPAFVRALGLLSRDASSALHRR